MKVKELIESLSKVDPELTVCVSAESFVYSDPKMVRVYTGAHVVSTNVRGKYHAANVDGPFVLIGDFGDYIAYDEHDAEVKE